jgi:hypothetical protein
MFDSACLRRLWKQLLRRLLRPASLRISFSEYGRFLIRDVDLCCGA